MPAWRAGRACSPGHCIAGLIEANPALQTCRRVHPPQLCQKCRAFAESTDEHLYGYWRQQSQENTEVIRWDNKGKGNYRPVFQLGTRKEPVNFVYPCDRGTVLVIDEQGSF